MEMGVKRRTVSTLVSRLGSVSEQARAESLAELRLLTKHDPEVRPVVASFGAIPYLSECLYSSSFDVQENAAATLLNVSISTKEELISDTGLLDALSHVLRHHSSSSSPSAVQAAAATIYSLLVQDSYRPVIGSKRDILYSLVDIIRFPRSASRSIKDALKVLFLVAQHPSNRPALVGLGAVEVLFSLLMKDGRDGIVEDATAVIAQVAGCADSESEFGRVSGIRVLFDLLETCLNLRIKENVVGALLNLVRNGGEGVVTELREIAAGFTEGITDVLQRGSDRGRSKAAALLDVVVGEQWRVSD